MVGRNYFREIDKHCTLKKNPFPAIKYSSLLQEKKAFFGTTTLLWISLSYEILFHYGFCTSVSNCSNLLFQRL